MRHRITRKRALVALLALVLVAAGVAVAAWLTSGSGPGAAKAGELADLVVTADASVITKQLVPGGTGDVGIKVENPGTTPLILKSYVGPSFGTAVTAPGCTGSVTWTGLVNGTLPNIPLAAGASVSVKIADALTMNAAAPDSCQGVSFTTPNITVNASTN